MPETTVDMGMVSAPTQADHSPAQSPAPSQRVTPGSPEWAALTAEQRHDQLRGPANPRAQGHSPARDIYEAAAAKRDGAPKPAPQAGQASEPGADAQKFKVGKFEVSEAELEHMLSRQSQDDLKRATLPANADAYKLELPEGTVLPGGQKFEFDAKDPGLAAVRNLAHAKGWTQSDLSDVLSVYASHVAQQQASMAEAANREIAKAGPNAPQRVDAVGKWIAAMVGEADAKPIRATLVTDAHLRFYERLMTQHISQGAASFSQQHRVAPDANKIPGFDTMSFEQRRLAQEQLAARGRR